MTRPGPEGALITTEGHSDGNFAVTYRDFLARSARTLPESDSAFLDVSLLLARCLGITRTELLGRMPVALDRRPEDPALQLFDALMARRRSGESVAYILGCREFFGHSFTVTKAVLVPRPDTETLVQAALEIGDLLALESGQSCRPLRLHDACAGSGAVAISIAGERPRWQVGASDLSEGALTVARENSLRLLGREIPFVRSDLLSGVAPAFDIITANPPYVTSAEVDALMAAGWKEPRLALDGGPDGLELIRRLILQVPSRLSHGGYFLVETDPFQVDTVCAMLSEAGFDGLRVWQDLAGRGRVSGGRLP